MSQRNLTKRGSQERDGALMYGDTVVSLLDYPEARALLADAEISTGDVWGCRDLVIRFLKRYF